MILTKEQQEAWIMAYRKTHTASECFAFIDGINKVIEAFENNEQKPENKTKNTHEETT